jgi:phage terminase large subunit-like protein
LKDYVAKANQYVDDVLAGRIIACKWVKLACQRQRDDLAKTWEYYFDSEAANDVCSFLELLTHVKGEHGGETLVLENWQCFYMTTVFGWKQKANGRRRFRR